MPCRVIYCLRQYSVWRQRYAEGWNGAFPLLHTLLLSNVILCGFVWRP